jgi:hypothetical protein
MTALAMAISDQPRTPASRSGADDRNGRWLLVSAGAR